MPKAYPRELIGYTVSCSGLCDDGRIATYSASLMDAWIEQARIGGWRFLAGVFTDVQRELTFFHSDLDPTKLKWRVEGIYRIRQSRETLIRKPRPTGELTASELARLP
jgi:hypothetical protein